MVSDDDDLRGRHEFGYCNEPRGTERTAWIIKITLGLSLILILVALFLGSATKR